MRPILTADEYQRVDDAYEGDLGEAMDRAGHAVALAASRAGAGYGRSVVVLAGPGNNGGDGYVAARYLRNRGAYVQVAALGEPKTPLSFAAADEAVRSGVRVGELGPRFEADVVVDALFGGGVRGRLPDEVISWMATTAPVVAVDYPTGLDPNTGQVGQRSFRATETVTFCCLKTGHVRGRGPDLCGKVTVTDIGIRGGEPSMLLAAAEDAPLPSRARRDHKWSAGSVLVLGGSTGMVGAASLAGRAALNFGAGTVAVASPRVDLVQQVVPELLAYTLERAEADLSRFDVVIAGPGLADADAEPVRSVLRRARRVVLDAGALTPASLAAAKEGGAQVVLTPHDAEFARVAGIGAGTYAVRAFAKHHDATVLRKGNPTTVSDGGLPVIVASGGPELASIGTGDVLAGMIAALWARGLRPAQAAVSAAYWHGVAGADMSTSKTVTAAALAEHVSLFAW